MGELGTFALFELPKFLRGTFFTGRIKALLLRHKTTAAATNAAWLRQPLRPATAAAAIEKAQ